LTELEPGPDEPQVSDDWSLLHAERAALAAELENLTDAQWATPRCAPT
jgi:hypothetical protein